MVNEDFIITEYPLHWFVWNNNYEQLEETLKKGEHDKDKIDNRGRTPLMLAVTLGHLESARILLNYQSNVNYENKDGWTVVQEAVATGDPELLQMVVERRDLQRYKNRMGGIPELLQKLKEAPDFYVEMKWDFTSWVPLVSRRCPSDTYKVYKQGSNVRVDTTLMGFENANWKRGNRSYVFLGKTDGATMMEIDHDLQQVYCEEMKTTEEFFENVLPNEEIISQRLTNPIITAYIDTDKISFERNKSGIWGWRSDKNEEINNYECKVFSATNVELITKTRSEHLTENDKIRSRNLRTPLQNFFNIPEIGTSENNVEYSNNTNPCNIKPEEYFDSALDLGDRDIGRPKEVNVKVQKFRANLWLCEDYPLSLPEQILPIVDLMAISSSHFAKLKDFIQMQLPSGFPVKIEIPIIQVLNARITFGNIFALDRAEPKVSILQEDDRPTCILDESLFQPPKGYMEIGNVGSDGRRQFSNEEEDDLLQFAIQQSLNESGIENDEEKVDIYEALCLEKSPTVKNSETTELQRAIQASLVEMYQEPATVPFDADPSATSIHNSYTDLDYDLTLALTVSKRESEQEELDRRKEEELLQLALNLSLEEK